MDVDNFYVEFGKRLRSYRRASGMSQNDVAKEIGVRRTSISNMEAGKQRPPLHMLYRLAATLHCNPSSLLPLEKVDSKVDRHTFEQGYLLGQEELKNELRKLLED